MCYVNSLTGIFESSTAENPNLKDGSSHHLRKLVEDKDKFLRLCHLMNISQSFASPSAPRIRQILCQQAPTEEENQIIVYTIIKVASDAINSLIYIKHIGECHNLRLTKM